MKKIISILLILMLAVSVFATVGVASAAEDLVINSWDFYEDWEDYMVKDYTGKTGDPLILTNGSNGDWKVHYEYSGNDVIQIVDGETWEHDGVVAGEGHGKVIYVNNRVSNGTYVNFGYVGVSEVNGEHLYARNFTLEYDFMPLHSDRSSGWTGLISRWTGTGVPDQHYSNSINVISTASMTTGTSADTITNSDGSTRPATGTDYGWHTRSATASGTGAADMTYESGIDKVSDRMYRIDGGGFRYTWFTMRIEAKDSFYTMYIKEKCTDSCEDDCTLHRWFDTGTRYYTDINNNIYSGTIGFGQCATEFLYDNINFKSNDGNPVKATNTTKNGEGKEVGKARIMSTTAADGSVIELISETEAGYVFDKWYTNADLTMAVTPVEFTLQEYVMNPNYGLYDWETVIGATDDIKTWNDLSTKTVFVKDDKIVDAGTSGAEEMLWRDYYATSADRKFRLITRVVTGDSGDGFDFYSTASLKEFKVNIYSNDTEMGTVDSTGFVDGLGMFVLGKTGTFVATPNDGYKFAGWYKEIKGQNPDDQGGIKDETFTIKVSDSPNFDFTLTDPSHVAYKAVFVPETAEACNLVLSRKSLSQTASAADCGEVITIQGAYFEGEVVSLIAQEYEGYAFVGWLDANGEYFAYDKYVDYVIQKDEDLTDEVNPNALTAAFEIETFRIFVVDGIGSDEVEMTAQKGSRVTLYPATAPTGYQFSGWLVTGIASTDWNTDESGKLEINITSRTIRVQARFVKVTHRVSITLSDKDHGSALGAGNKAVGDRITITPSPKAGYTVSRYVVRGVDATINPNGTLSFTMPDEDVIIRVEFAKIDNIDTGSEILMYAIFTILGLGIVASILFANKKDKRDKRG